MSRKCVQTELRYVNGTELDEVVVAHPKSVHLERMDDDEVWLGIYLRNGRVIHVSLAAVVEKTGTKLEMSTSDFGESAT